MAAGEKLIHRQLLRLMKAYDRCARAVGGVPSSEAELDAEFERFLVLLGPETVPSLDQFMKTSRSALLGELDEWKVRLQEAPEVFREEAAMLRELDGDVERLVWFFALYVDNSELRDQCPATRAELSARLRALHGMAKERLSKSRVLGRKEKKKRKRKLGQGTTSLLLGAGAIALNAHISFAPSYGIGGGALIQAGRDFVGEKDE